ncbi:hypothetical protein [Ancylobacter pratisalsi]|uniref:Uncharacterized protein n=1 Tax=Ancylobacter pratisalsi TaxID=1745854 RepID=A0A6P1YHQ8_9HYPH|nr:hypothetical protein [Ancylobacter pratisalsi]QIB32256.1 hypothetical protein G3A50_12900 [Ancylobacter pratisalsi]
MNGKEDQERADRLAAALRENLKRRKAQARGRKDGPGVADAEAGAETTVDRVRPPPVES